MVEIMVHRRQLILAGTAIGSFNIGCLPQDDKWGESKCYNIKMDTRTLNENLDEI